MITPHALVGILLCHGLMVASSWPMKFDGDIDAVISGCWLVVIEALPVCHLVLELAIGINRQNYGVPLA